jgi:dihydrodipicolinate synthase/N-acetylneuraminate lyase
VTDQRWGTGPIADLGGVLPVFQTPFDDRYAIDYGELGNEIDWLFENGADGIVLGMVSEVLRLSISERDDLVRKACALAAGRGPVVASATAESTEVAVAIVRAAEDAGASAVMCTLPVSGPVLAEQAFRHFEKIVHSTAIPVVVQDAGGYVGHELPLETMARIEAAFPERILFKPETPPLGQRISVLHELTGGRARIYEGMGGIALVDGYHRGLFGTMPAADICWAITALWTALRTGDEAVVRRIRGPLTALIALQSQLDAFVALEKHLLVAQKVIGSTRMRGPVGYQLDPETAREAERLMTELQDATAGLIPGPAAPVGAADAMQGVERAGRQ